MASTFFLFQAAAVTSLIGMTLGWRGVMTKYSGFYDLPTAWSNVFWGILLGGIYASTSHNFILLPYLNFVADDASTAFLKFKTVYWTPHSGSQLLDFLYSPPAQKRSYAVFMDNSCFKEDVGGPFFVPHFGDVRTS